jgi:prepilin-type N-terminal cleavage/methylation domain-containing protein/prepilin-type processing-associated H-X9-DG protein
MFGRKGFTLIELLVVIAIIALLLLILVPALQKAKALASGIVCLSTQKQLALAWSMYATANSGNNVGGECRYSTVNGVPPWVMPPLRYDSSGAIDPMGDDAGVTQEHRLNGLREGALSTYLDSPKLFHCPADPRPIRGVSLTGITGGTEPYYRIYRTYSMPSGMAANRTNQQRNAMATGWFFRPVIKVAQIRRSGDTYIFVEEAYDGYMTGRNYNDEFWNYEPYGSSNHEYKYDLHDPLANLHVKSCTFGFADGHAEKYKFKDSTTVEFWADRLAPPYKDNIITDDGNLDCEWLTDGFPGIPAQ